MFFHSPLFIVIYFFLIQKKIYYKTTNKHGKYLISSSNKTISKLDFHILQQANKTILNLILKQDKDSYWRFRVYRICSQKTGFGSKDNYVVSGNLEAWKFT